MNQNSKVKAMNRNRRSSVPSAVVVCLGVLLACIAGDYSLGGPSDSGEYVAKTNASLWSMTSVLELYKLSGWRLLDVKRIWANKDWPKGDPRTRHNAFTDLAYSRATGTAFSGWERITWSPVP